MTRQPRVYDSWALIALLEDEPAADKVEESIAEAQDIEDGLLITAINMGEVWYSLARVRSEGDAQRALEEILGLGFKIVEIDWELAKHAARLKARNKITYADCFAAALAQQRKVEVVTGDPEFKKLQQQVKVRWLS